MREVNVQERINQVVIQPLPPLQSLPAMLPLEGAVRIELEEGIPVFRASDVIQERIEDLIEKQRRGRLSRAETEELDRYEEIDDYLSVVNRVMRNVIQAQ